MCCNIVILKGNVAIVLDDKRFEYVKRKYRKFFCKYITVVDVRDKEITFLRKDIIMLEKGNEEEKENKN